MKYYHRYFVLFLGLLAFFQTANAFTDLPVGARSLAMGGTHVGFINSPDAVFLNPAGLGQMRGLGISLFYQKPFALADVHFGTISVCLPLSTYRFGFGYIYLGNNLYSEQKFNIAFSHRFFQTILLGINTRLQTINIENYGSTSRLGFDFGVMVPINENFSWGFTYQNINRPGIVGSEQNLPQIIKAGFSLKAVPQLTLNMDIYKDVRYPQEVRFGIEFSPLKQLRLRAGTATNPDLFSAGFGLSVRRFQVDYAFFTHNDLGLTHQMSFSFYFGSEKKTPAGKQNVKIKKLPATEKPVAKKVDLNSANVQELTVLPGIGTALAKEVISFRDAHGPFLKIKDIMQIPGVGKHTFERIKDKITILSNK